MPADPSVPARSGPPKGRIIVFGILFFYPLAGVTYQFLHYLIALRRLGWDPYYVEDSGRWVYSPELNDLTGDAAPNVSKVAAVLERFGFADRWAFRGNYPDAPSFGLDGAALTRLYRETDAFLNVTASQELRDEHMQIPHRIYIESDPFPAQVRADAGDADTIAFLKGHTAHFSFGENLGAPDCDLPLAGIDWLPTRQPVVVDLWANDADVSDAPYTTITTWHNRGKDLQYRGDTYYWTKDREFMRVIQAPGMCRSPLELAVRADQDGESLLRGHGWRLADSGAVSADVDRYRSYITGSRGEFTVARDQYVRPRTGWFSDRSACYLAAGRPVVTQETGFSKHLPTGEGLFGFSTVEEAVAALEMIDEDYARHSRGALEVAREHFSAEVVVSSLLDRAGL